MITPKDIENPSKASGYDYVTFGRDGRPGRSDPNPYYAKKRLGIPGETGGSVLGPRRDNAFQAAQDYCDYINSGKAVHKPRKLKSAGHKAPALPKPPRDAEVEAALGVLRDAKAQRDGRQGYVYCITDGEYIKIGYSVAPEKRIAELQTGNARPLALLGKVEGTLADEAALHSKYIKQNVLAEWFRLDPSIIGEFV